MKSAPAEPPDSALDPWQLRLRAALCAFALVSPIAHAEEPDKSPIPVELVFSAPEDCAVASDFRERVARRSQRIHFVEGGDSAARIVANVTPGSGDVRVRLTLSKADGTSLTREFGAPNCSEGVDAIALVTAITLDRFARAQPIEQSPSPSTGRDVPPEPEPEAPPEPKAPPEPEAPPEVESAASQPPEVESAASQPPELDRAPTGAGAESTEWHVSLSGAVEGLSGAAPVGVAGASAAVGASFEGKLLAPLVRLVGSHFPAVTYPAEGGDATFVVDAARLVACPLRLGTRAYGIRPCFAGLGGRILARGSRTEARESHSVPLWATGGVLLAVVRPTAPIVVLGELGVFAPFRRDAFRFAPSEEFHRVSSALVQGGVGLGLEFP